MEIDGQSAPPRRGGVATPVGAAPRAAARRGTRAPWRALPLVAAWVLAACAGATAGRVEGPGAVAPAPDGSLERWISVPDRGALGVLLPAAWMVARIDRRPGESGPPVTFEITPTDDRFTISLAPIEEEGEGPPTLEEAARCAEWARSSAAARAAEQELPLRPVKARGGTVGYWFAATDRELLTRTPSPDEWRGTLQGCALVGELLLAFRILDDLPGQHRAQLLEALAGARHLPPEPEGEPTWGLEAVDGASEVRASFPGRGWTVALSAPGLAVAPARAGSDGASVRAGARDRGSGARITLLLRAADGARSAAACREPEWARLLGAPGGLRDGRAWEERDAAHASFTASDGRAVTRAWYLRDGVCVRAELSAPRAAGGTAAYELILRSLRFEEGATEIGGMARSR